MFEGPGTTRGLRGLWSRVYGMVKEVP
jgi:hypothetical protein